MGVEGNTRLSPESYTTKLLENKIHQVPPRARENGGS